MPHGSDRRYTLAARESAINFTRLPERPRSSRTERDYSVDVIRHIQPAALRRDVNVEERRPSRLTTTTAVEAAAIPSRSATATTTNTTRSSRREYVVRPREQPRISQELVRPPIVVPVRQARVYRHGYFEQRPATSRHTRPHHHHNQTGFTHLFQLAAARDAGTNAGFSPVVQQQQQQQSSKKSSHRSQHQSSSQQQQSSRRRVEQPTVKRVGPSRAPFTSDPINTIIVK